MKNKNKQYLNYTGITIIIFVIQQLASKLGGFSANIFSYNKIDPQNIFAYISVHHIFILGFSLLIIYTFKKLYNIEFGVKLGNVKKGLKYVNIFTLFIFTYILLNHLIGVYFDLINPINFPLNIRNVLGTLSFQLLLSGPAEELLFRAIPISILVYTFKKRNIKKIGISLETIIAAFLFSIAHIRWSFSPLVLNFDYYQLIYAFGLGLVYGKTYQKTESILYPMLMHSISNVIYVGVGYLYALIL